jgi:hypothetical protein
VAYRAVRTGPDQYVTAPTLGNILTLNKFRVEFDSLLRDYNGGTGYLASQAASDSGNREFGLYHSGGNIDLYWGGSYTNNIIIGADIVAEFGSSTLDGDVQFEFDVVNATYKVFKDFSATPFKTGSFVKGNNRTEGTLFRLGARSGSNDPASTSGAFNEPSGTKVGDVRVYANEVLIRNMVANGVGSNWEELVSSADGTLRNYATNGSQWESYGTPPPSSGVTTTGSFSLPLIATAGTVATVTPAAIVVHSELDESNTQYYDSCTVESYTSTSTSVDIVNFEQTVVSASSQTEQFNSFFYMSDVPTNVDIQIRHLENNLWSNVNHSFVYSYDCITWSAMTVRTDLGSQIQHTQQFTQSGVYIARLPTIPTWRMDEIVSGWKAHALTFPSDASDANFIADTTTERTSVNSRVAPAGLNLYEFIIKDDSRSPATRSRKLVVSLSAGCHPTEMSGYLQLVDQVNWLLAADTTASQNLLNECIFIVRPSLIPSSLYCGYFRSDVPATADAGTSNDCTVHNSNRYWGDGLAGTVPLPTVLQWLTIFELSFEGKLDVCLDNHTTPQNNQKELFISDTNVVAGTLTAMNAAGDTFPGSYNTVQYAFTGGDEVGFQTMGWNRLATLSITPEYSVQKATYPSDVLEFATSTLSIIGKLITDDFVDNNLRWDGGTSFNPAPNISGYFSLPVLTVLGNQSSDLPQPVITSSFTLPSLVTAGNVSVTLPSPELTGAFSFPVVNISGAINAGLPAPQLSGSFDFPLITVTGNQSAVIPAPVLSASFTLPVLTVTGSQSADVPTPVLSGSFSLPLFSVSGSVGSAQSSSNINVWGPVNVWGNYPFPTITGSFSLPVLTTTGLIDVTLPTPVSISGSFSLPKLTTEGFIAVSGVVIVINSNTNINQLYLDNNIDQEYLSNNITYP